jgi:hypothetical protein
MAEKNIFLQSGTNFMLGTKPESVITELNEIEQAWKILFHYCSLLIVLLMAVITNSYVT